MVSRRESEESSTPAVGGYLWDTGADTWWWSPGFYRIHGYRPGEVPATTKRLLDHVHADDRAVVAERIAELRDGGVFSIRHRIVDVDGHERAVVADGVAERGETPGEALVIGYVTSAADAPRQEEAERLRDEIHNAWAAHESVSMIERAKGMIMLACDCDSATAFDTLARISQNANVKVRDISEDIVALVAGESHHPLGSRIRRIVLRELLRTKRRTRE